MPAEANLDALLPEFYLLSFLEKRFNRNDRPTGDKQVITLIRRDPAAGSTLKIAEPLSSVGVGSSAGASTIALSSRAAKQKHDDLVRLRRVEPKVPTMTLADKVFKDLHRPQRKLYSRGHCVPNPSTPAPLHPAGAAPVVLRAHDMGSSGRNATTARPLTASERFSPVKKPASRGSGGGGGGGGGGGAMAEGRGPLYVRPTQRVVLNSRGAAIAEDCARSSWQFRRPLDAITMPRPSTFASSLLNAPLPDCAECLLEDPPYATLACAARNRILEKTTNADRLFLVASRSSKGPYPAPHPGEAPYCIDYAAPGSPDRRKRPVFRKSPFDR